MTTKVLIAIEGNKEVEIIKEGEQMILPPGQWTELHIHGELSISIKETGPFVTRAPGVRYEKSPMPTEQLSLAGDSDVGLNAGLTD